MPTFQIKYAWAFWRINHPSNKARAEVEGVEGVGEQYNNVNNNPSFLTLLPTYSEPYPKCCIYYTPLLKDCLDMYKVPD